MSSSPQRFGSSPQSDRPGSSPPAEMTTGSGRRSHASWTRMRGRAGTDFWPPPGRRADLWTGRGAGTPMADTAVRRGRGRSGARETVPATAASPPGPALVTSPQAHPSSETESVVRARLRELPLIHVLTVAMAAFWRSTILGDDDRQLRSLDTSAIAVLGTLFVLLWSRWRVSLAWLQALELGMIGMLAIVEYRLVLRFSLREEPMMAQLIMKNVVLLTAILIPSFGFLRPQELTPCRIRGGTARVAAVCDPVGPIRPAPGRNGLAWAGVEVKRSPTVLMVQP
jgi:hypothetical protein